jgi:branched-chain amino acid aminotransferase
LSSGALAGITRECVIEIANQHFIPLLEGIYEIQDLTEADEIFLTSSGVGVAPVTTFDFRRYAVEGGPLTTTIARAFRRLWAAD